MMLVMVFLEFMEEGTFVFTCINVMKHVMSEVVADVSYSKANPEEGEENGVVNSDDFDG